MKKLVSFFCNKEINNLLGKEVIVIKFSRVKITISKMSKRGSKYMIDRVDFNCVL